MRWGELRTGLPLSMEEYYRRYCLSSLNRVRGGELLSIGIYEERAVKFYRVKFYDVPKLPRATQKV
jgi:hypothetical protein